MGISLSFYDFIQNIGRKSYDTIGDIGRATTDFSEKISKIGVISDEERLNASNLVMSPIKFIILSILTFGFFPFTILFRLFPNKKLSRKSLFRFLYQIECIAKKRGVKIEWRARTLANLILFFNGLFTIVFFAAGGISAHSSNGEPFIYHAPPIIILATIPIGLCMFRIIDAINHCAGDPFGETNILPTLTEIWIVLFILGNAYIFYKYGINDHSNGVFYFLDDLFQ